MADTGRFWMTAFIDQPRINLINGEGLGASGFATIFGGTGNYSTGGPFK
jgi:hypothetical protein